MKHTDRKLLMKGIKYMAGALPLAFLGPVLLTSSFKNQEHPWFLPVLILALTVMFFSVLLMFKGIKTIMNALFE